MWSTAENGAPRANGAASTGDAHGGRVSALVGLGPAIVKPELVTEHRAREYRALHPHVQQHPQACGEWPPSAPLALQLAATAAASVPAAVLSINSGAGATPAAAPAARRPKPSAKPLSNNQLTRVRAPRAPTLPTLI